MARAGRRRNVSTHSRPKAAGPENLNGASKACRRFNTQPPEGGWVWHRLYGCSCGCFNTQPPEGGWHSSPPSWRYHQSFNTQPPEGGWIVPLELSYFVCSFNTQPPEGGWPTARCWAFPQGCFNTQPPEGGWRMDSHRQTARMVSTHSRPKAAGSNKGRWLDTWQRFQHTAARRRLAHRSPLR